MSLEREVKMGAAPSFHLPGFDGLVESVKALPPEELRLETTYYDTPDLRLARWGCSLRFRQGEGWTLKLPAPSEGAALVRRELEFPGTTRKVPAEAIELVRAYVRGATLVPVARLSTLRVRIRLADSRGRVLAEVVDDEVSILDGRRVAARFRELEVELKAGDQTLLDALVARLRAAGAGPPDTVPKHIRALGPAALEPPEVHPRPLPDDASAGDVVQRAIAASVESLMRHDPGVRLNDDPEDVHQARVATRRLRSHLRLFRTLLDPAWSEPLRTELAWLADELGTVRDAQVLADRLKGRAADLPPVDLSKLRRLTKVMDGEVEQEVQKLESGIGSDRYLALLESLIDAAQSPRLLPEADLPAAQVMPGLTQIAWRKLRSAVRRLPDDPPDADLHQVRILAKRARYAAEAAAPVFGKRASTFAKAVAELQTVLGEHQDSVTAQGWLRAHARGSLAFVAGELVAIERAAAARARERWPAVWKAARRRELREWMKVRTSV